MDLSEERIKVSTEFYLKQNQRKDDLWWALRTRPLTPEEMDEVRKFGSDILLKMNPSPTGGASSISYNPREIELEFNEALAKQAMMLIEEKRNAEVGE